jgi:type IV pilus assembly protein PilB
MVGEIRDTATADLSIRSALTGHLVFSTLHTKDSVSVITRLTNMGVEPYLLAAVLRCSIAQRLVRRICVNCKEEYRPTAMEKELFTRHGMKPGLLYRGKGCKKCLKTGYSGRTGIFELFQSDETIEQMIIKDKRESEIREYIISRGMKPLLINGLEKVLEGVTTVKEIERITAV